MTSILSHPFFQPLADRAIATSYVQSMRIPVLRCSSIPGRYAITYAVGTNIHHSLLRENENGTVDIISEDGSRLQRFLNILSVISTVWNPMPYIASVRDEDPQPCIAS